MFALQGKEEFICDATSSPRRKRTADNQIIQRLSLTLCYACGPFFVYKSCCQWAKALCRTVQDCTLINYNSMYPRAYVL